MKQEINEKLSKIPPASIAHSRSIKNLTERIFKQLEFKNKMLSDLLSLQEEAIKEGALGVHWTSTDYKDFELDISSAYNVLLQLASSYESKGYITEVDISEKEFLTFSLKW